MMKQINIVEGWYVLRFPVQDALQSSANVHSTVVNLKRANAFCKTFKMLMTSARLVDLGRWVLLRKSSMKAAASSSVQPFILHNDSDDLYSRLVNRYTGVDSSVLLTSCKAAIRRLYS